MTFTPDSLYSENYYKTYSDAPYERSEHWYRTYNSIVRHIMDTLAPTSVLDAGCALGISVEVFREHGVDAMGFDISEYAVSQVPESLRPYVLQGSILDSQLLPRKFDLVTCIEVVEHLQPQEAERAVENLCRWSDQVLISSFPEHYGEPTHFNIQQPGYWAEKFARHGFVHVLDYDAGFINPWAMLFCREKLPLSTIVRRYEDQFWLKIKEITTLRTQIINLQSELDQVVRCCVGRKISPASCQALYEAEEKQA